MTRDFRGMSAIEIKADGLRRQASKANIPDHGPITPWEQLPESTQAIWLEIARKTPGE